MTKQLLFVAASLFFGACASSGLQHHGTETGDEEGSTANDEIDLSTPIVDLSVAPDLTDPVATECNIGCNTDSDCQQSCPNTGGLTCCDQMTSTCYTSQTGTCPPPEDLGGVTMTPY